MCHTPLEPAASQPPRFMAGYSRWEPGQRRGETRHLVKNTPARLASAASSGLGSALPPFCCVWVLRVAQGRVPGGGGREKFVGRRRGHWGGGLGARGAGRELGWPPGRLEVREE